MINKIVDLSAQLRQKDVPVSIRSTKAAIQVYEDLGEEDRNLLKTALMAVYVKDKYDIPKFNKVFEEIFANHHFLFKICLRNDVHSCVTYASLSTLHLSCKNDMVSTCCWIC